MSVPKFSCGQNPTLWAACTGAGSPVLWWGAETLLQGQKDEGSHRLCEFSSPAFIPEDEVLKNDDDDYLFIYLFILPHNIAFPNAEAEKQDRYSWTSRAGRNTKVIKIWLVLGEGSWNAFIKVVCRLPTRVIVQCPVYRSLADLIT